MLKYNWGAILSDKLPNVETLQIPIPQIGRTEICSGKEALIQRLRNLS